jgi:hypothetical protein
MEGYTNKIRLIVSAVFSTEHWGKGRLARFTKVSFVTVLEMQWRCQ